MSSTGLLQALSTHREGIEVAIAVFVATVVVLAVIAITVELLRRSPFNVRPAGVLGVLLVAVLIVASLFTMGVAARQALLNSRMASVTGVPRPRKRSSAPSPSPRPAASTAPSTAPTLSPTPSPTPAIDSQTVNVTSGGLQRTYNVLTPSDPVSQSLPVVVFLHGLNATIQVEEERDGLEPYVLAGQVILVYPVAEDEVWDAEPDDPTSNVDDVTFLSTVLQQAAQLPNANPQRVYLAGFSHGAKMAWDLACVAPQLFSALVIVAAVPVTPCANAQPTMSLLQMAGTDDPQVPYSEVTPEVAAWAQGDGCSPTPATNDASPQITTYSGCSEGTTVILASYQGEGHVWPGGGDEALPGPIMWSFISALP
jgi:polyhydroxybutyrate depolymerase